VTGPVWRKSSRSGTEQGACVEMADLAGNIGVRDSKDPDGPRLVIDTVDWRTLARRIKNGEHDLA
jgi:uncharacterized protein DUF397